MSMVGLINALAYLVFSIALVWQASSEMIHKKKILFFSPFLFMGLAACFYAAFILQGDFEDFARQFFEYIWDATVVWIIVSLWREEKWPV